MLERRFLIMLWVTIVSVLGMAACGTPGRERTAGARGPSSETATPSNQDQNSGEGVVIDVTPIPDAELATRPPGQTEPGAGAADGGPPAEPDAQDKQLQPETMIVY